MKSAELRKMYLDYFAERGHLVIPSSSLVPYKDPSVLLTTAGMQPLKPYFMGLAEPPNRRLASVQKCFRTSDIDRVGLTARHCTFFEMLGNFSIGDYFKEGAIRFAWEYSLDRLGLEPERIWISYFEGDDDIEADEEAVQHWTEIGVPPERMVGLPRSANFWGPVGPTGPCGPCSELYYDRGPEHGCSDPGCRPAASATATWSTGTWSSRATTWTRNSGSPHSRPRTSTRAWVWRGWLPSSKECPRSFTPTYSGRWSNWEKSWPAGASARTRSVDVALRVLADHSRAMTFLVADGVLPGNEGRGYVLRRVIRRAARFSRSAGMEPPLLRRFAARTIELMGGAYPELGERRDTILRVLHSEEERFNRTLDQGLVLVEEAIARAKGEDGRVFPAGLAFQLHDTYGFPVEVTRELVEEQGLSLDLEQFEAAMDDQRTRAREAQKGGSAYQDVIARFARETVHPTEFKGYEREDLYTVVENVEALDDGRILLALRESPFYAEMGGQTADTGLIESETGAGGGVGRPVPRGGPGHSRPAARGRRSRRTPG